ncbi:putative F-box and FNIP repeat-containing protein [Megavirus lba]|uniref:Putative F-box and FNIP repeat-containing protein n=1 Tax=Megavirus lba TaxID=1235314 RepID=L7Y498_9VIRU|nr:putative F-box and FNIP repeat-containing protein [Megavirus lba]
MNISDLNKDSILYLMKYLPDNDKMNFMKTCQKMYVFREHIRYNNFYEYDKIKHLNFVSKFARLIYRENSKMEISTSIFTVNSIKMIKKIDQVQLIYIFQMILTKI